jgi:hypothetical protein
MKHFYLEALKREVENFVNIQDRKENQRKTDRCCYFLSCFFSVPSKPFPYRTAPLLSLLFLSLFCQAGPMPKSIPAVGNDAATRKEEILSTPPLIGSVHRNPILAENFLR